jgi:hypothetical protein
MIILPISLIEALGEGKAVNFTMIDLFLMDQKKFIHLIKFPEKHSMAEQE